MEELAEIFVPGLVHYNTENYVGNTLHWICGIEFCPKGRSGCAQVPVKDDLVRGQGPTRVMICASELREIYRKQGFVVIIDRTLMTDEEIDNFMDEPPVVQNKFDDASHKIIILVECLHDLKKTGNAIEVT